MMVYVWKLTHCWFDSSPPGQNGHHFADELIKWDFINENCCTYFDSNFTEVCSWGSNWQKVSTGSGNGLALNRWQAIIWTNVDPVRRHIYPVLGGDELTIRRMHLHLILSSSSNGKHEPFATVEARSWTDGIWWMVCTILIVQFIIMKS